MKKLFLLFVFLCMASLQLYSSSPRLAFVEEVTSANCGSCASQNVAFNDYLSNNKDKAIPVIFHSGNSMPEPMYDYNQTILGPRIWGNYVSGTLGTPAAWVNGTKLSSLSALSSEVSKTAGKSSPISMWVFEHRNGEQCTLDVIVESDDGFNAQTKLAMVICEETLYFSHAGSNGETDFPWVARSMVPGSAASQAISLSHLTPGKRGTFSYTYTMDPVWNKSKTYVVAFIQNYTTKEVYQCAKTSPESMAKPQLQASVNSLDFGSVPSMITKTLTLKNNGFARLSFTDISIKNDPDHAFEITSGQPDDLMPGDEETFEITFSPKGNKAFSGAVSIKSNDPSASEITIPIAGEGKNVEMSPKIKTSFSSLDFGMTSTNNERPLKITNKGLTDLQITGIKIDKDPDGVFQIQNAGLSTIAPDSTYTLMIKFNPIDNTNYSAILKITSTATNTPELSVPLTGEGKGVAAKSNLVVSVEVVDFGKVSDNKTLPLNITNSGYGELEIQNNRIIDDKDGVFKIVTNMETTLNHGETSYNEIKFTPKANKLYTASFRITSTANNGAEKLVPIQGEGFGFVGVDDQDPITPVTLMPNPVTDKINLCLQSDNNCKAQISIFNSIGNNVATYNVSVSEGKNNIMIDVAKLSHGTYHIQADLNGKIIKTSFVK